MAEPKGKRRITIRARVTEAMPPSAMAELFNHMLAEARSDPELGEAVAQLFGVPSLDDAEFEIRVQPSDGDDPQCLAS